MQKQIADMFVILPLGARERIEKRDTPNRAENESTERISPMDQGTSSKLDADAPRSAQASTLKLGRKR